MSVPAVEMSGLTKSFGGLVAVDGVTMTIPAGQRRALIGPNGAGKTTLFNCITGTLPSTSGRIRFFGREVTGMAEHSRTGLGMGRTYQITNVFAELTVLENVLLAVNGNSTRKWIPARLWKKYPDSLKRAEKELERFGLADRLESPAKELSYGEKRQLEFALAMAGDPKAIFLDEPCSGLSPAERSRVAEIISGLPKEMTVILIEHDMDVALGLVDQVAVLQNGRIILEGTPEEVRSSPECREVYLGDAC